MHLHIGQKIKERVKKKGLTQAAFGALVHKHAKTIPNIFKRRFPSVDLILKICEVLDEDLVKHLYDEEPLKSLRNDEIKKHLDEIKRRDAKIEQLEKELAIKQELIDTQKNFLSVITEERAEYKKLKKDQSANL